MVGLASLPAMHEQTLSMDTRQVQHNPGGPGHAVPKP